MNNQERTMERPQRWLWRRSSAICAVATVLFFLPPGQAAADVTKAAEALVGYESPLPPLGGDGGGQFTARCPQNQYLAGVRLRVGDDVDAILPLCRTYGLSPYLETETVFGVYGDERTAQKRTVERWKAELGPIEPYPDFIGGSGGSRIVDVLCKNDIVTGFLVGDEGVYTRTVNRLGVFCDLQAQAWSSDRAGNLTSCEYSTASRSREISEEKPYGWTLTPVDEFEGPEATANEGFFSDDEVSRGEADQHCSCGQAAVGIAGRAGKWLDAVGLICGEFKPVKAVRAVGRVKLAPGGGTSLPPLPICIAARQARERNSPAAPGLEAKCAAEAPVKAQGRVKLDPSNTTPASARRICELAAQALVRNSPAARGLAEKCAAEKSLPPPPIDLNALQARGAEIAAAEPEAGTLRDQQGAARRGFEIGLAAAEWHTLPGPGKQSIHDMLSYVKQSTFGPSEQTAFDAAVTYSLALYKQKLDDLATRGAAMTVDDPLSAEFRSRQAEGDARRGFEIGLAAAEGHTAQGPGKQKIRGALVAAEQAGYDAAVAFTIERNNN